MDPKRIVTALPRRQAPAVRVKDTGYRTYLEVSGTRFNGRASHSDDAKLIAEARTAQEPDWYQLVEAELIAAEKMARSKMSGGEKKWARVLERIRAAMVAKGMVRTVPSHQRWKEVSE